LERNKRSSPYWYGERYCQPFAVTGYGNLSPSTDTGRIVMVGYAVIGVPINGIVMARMAEFFSRTVSMFTRVCYVDKNSEILDDVILLTCVLLVFMQIAHKMSVITAQKSRYVKTKNQWFKNIFGKIRNESQWLIPVAARYKTWVCACSLAGIAGSNPARCMDLLRVLCVFR